MTSAVTIHVSKEKFKKLVVGNNCVCCYLGCVVLGPMGSRDSVHDKNSSSIHHIWINLRMRALTLSSFTV